MTATRLDATVIREKAIGRWREILLRLGLDLPATAKQHGPCPACGGKDRFRFDDQEGKGSWFCNQCLPQAGDGFDLVGNVRGCDFPQALQLVADALGYQPRNGDSSRTIIATYDYTDADNTVLFQVVRFLPKDFRQRRPDGQGGWIWNLKDCEPVLYKLPHVMQASSVLVVEGEKDVETAYRLGLPEGWAATCNPMGAGKWRDTYTETLKNKQVVILPDADAPGETHAAQVSQSLRRTASSVGRLALPANVKDLSLWANDRTSIEFHTLLSQFVPWTETASPAIMPVLSIVPEGWPELDRRALRGVLGDLVRAIEPHSEADPAALLIQSLVAYGNTLNRAPHFRAEADRHCMNLFAALVGETSKGRKGTSWGYIRQMFEQVDKEWTETRVLNGLSSGEGLIWAVRDPISKTEPIKERGRPTGDYQTLIVDQGVSDKRLLVMESEFAGVLSVMGREGNTLSALIRQAWDKGDLRTMTKHEPAQATGAHISLVVHVTKDELCRLMEANEASNGFCNRFLWLCVKRSKVLPEGGQFDATHEPALIERLKRAVTFGRGAGELKRDADTRAMWCTVYAELSEGKPGLLGAVTSRAEAQVMRLACLYALQDMSYVVQPDHLTAALALWEYCEASARYIFGQRLGDPIADALLTAFRSHVDGMTRTEIRDWFGRNRKAHEIDRGLTLLVKQGLARKEDSQPGEWGGRPIERWFSVPRATT
jgi:hypothetical protein